MDFTEEHDFFRKSFRDFLQKEVVPHIEKWEKTGSIDRFIWEKFGEMGYFGLVAHAYLAMTHLEKEGSHAQKEMYLTPSITGEKIGCLCVTEPFGGSDVGGMRTTAVKKGDTYVLNGSKTFITNGVYSDYLIVAAKTAPELGNKGISIFVVDRDVKGLSATKLDKKIKVSLTLCSILHLNVLSWQ